MTSEGILKEVRRRIGDVDGMLDELTLDFYDDFVFEYISSAVDHLDVSLITTASYTVSGTTVSPDPSKIDGLLIASLAAKMILEGHVMSKVLSGSLGVRFTSGQDSISTVEAGKMITRYVETIGSYYRNMVMAKLAGSDSGASRVQ